MRIDSKKKTVVGGGGAILDYFPRDILYYICFCGVLSEIISKKLNFPFASKLEISSVVCASQKWMFGAVIQNILINFELGPRLTEAPSDFFHPLNIIKSCITLSNLATMKN